MIAIGEKTERLTVRIEGPGFEQRYSAEGLALLLGATYRLIRLAAVSSIPKPSRGRVRLSILADFPDRGSFIQNVYLTWNSSAPDTAILPDVLAIIAAALGMLREALPWFSAAKKLPVSLSSRDGRVEVDGEPTSHTLEDLRTSAEYSRPLLQILDLLGGDFEQVELRDRTGRRFVISQSDRPDLSRSDLVSATRQFVAAASRLEKEFRRLHPAQAQQFILAGPLIQAIARIDSFDRTNNTGRLTVSESSSLSRRQYSFEVPAEVAGDILAGMARREVRIYGRKLGGKKLEILSLAMRPLLES